MPYPTPNYSLAVMAKTAIQFFEQNTVLADLQIGQETDTKRFKIGDGVTAWNTLPYAVQGNENSIWVGLSPDVGNLLELTLARNGFYLNPVTFDGTTVLNQSVDGTLTDITPYLSANQQLAGFVAAGLMIRKVILALGTDWNLNTTDPIPATTVTQAIDSVSDALTSLAGTVSSLINDSVVSASTTYSSTKIGTLVNDAIAAIIGAAPEALNTVYELAAALGNNPDLVTNIVTELGQTVKITAQTLTAPQQAQARTNIGAASAADLGNTDENTSTLAAKYLYEKSIAYGGIEITIEPNPLPIVMATPFVAKVISDGSVHREGIYALDTSGGSFITQMPANPLPGDEVEYLDYNGTFDTGPAELSPNGKKFMGLNESYILNQKNRGRRFKFVDENKGWMPMA